MKSGGVRAEVDLVDGWERVAPGVLGDRARFRSLLYSSVAALAAVVFGDGVDQVFAAEIGPELGDDIHFGIAHLPK